jgi:hypothetical protein
MPLNAGQENAYQQAAEHRTRYVRVREVEPMRRAAQSRTVAVIAPTAGCEA